MGFVSTVNRGYKMSFENGVTISVQWGTGNYCENKDLSKGYANAMGHETYSSNNAEILIIKGNETITKYFAEENNLSHDGHVVGWLEADKVAEAIMWAKNYK